MASRGALVLRRDSSSPSTLPARTKSLFLMKPLTATKSVFTWAPLGPASTVLIAALRAFSRSTTASLVGGRADGAVVGASSSSSTWDSRASARAGSPSRNNVCASLTPVISARAAGCFAAAAAFTRTVTSFRRVCHAADASSSVSFSVVSCSGSSGAGTSSRPSTNSGVIDTPAFSLANRFTRGVQAGAGSLAVSKTSTPPSPP